MTTQEQPLSTQEVANRFFYLADQGHFDQIVDELYSEDVKSIEPEKSTQATTVGLDKKKEKSRIWNESVEENHGGSIEEPIVAGNFFAITMNMDVTIKGLGRQEMDEIAVYQVENGKIVSEQFFF